MGFYAGSLIATYTNDRDDPDSMRASICAACAARLIEKAEANWAAGRWPDEIVCDRCYSGFPLKWTTAEAADEVHRPLIERYYEREAADEHDAEERVLDYLRGTLISEPAADGRRYFARCAHCAVLAICDAQRRSAPGPAGVRADR